ncbi:MAG: hypothetical protein INR62_03910 [Rhodospirillales bacterium]|nr:hypothetical protein [Acetobacter sp.]
MRTIFLSKPINDSFQDTMTIDSSIVIAAAAVMGSLVGGLASLSSTWFTQHYQGRRDYLACQIARRESLYADFISEAAQLYSTAF